MPPVLVEPLQSHFGGNIFPINDGVALAVHVRIIAATVFTIGRNGLRAGTREATLLAPCSLHPQHYCYGAGSRYRGLVFCNALPRRVCHAGTLQSVEWLSGHLPATSTRCS